tara:strand:+ start:652 stop:1731 length:1080 start_codon:yes stop_codon:yes gene_type:complete
MLNRWRFDLKRLIKININALKNNFEIVKKKSPNSKILAYVKQNAYGHDTSVIVSGLADADGFGVTDMESARTIRGIYPTKEILHASIFPTLDALQEARLHDIAVVVYNHEIVNLIIKNKLKLRIWLKVNTGFNRFGLRCEEAPQIIEKLRPYADGEIVVMTHFMNTFADSQHHKQQLKSWKNIISDYSGPNSYANSAPILRGESELGDWVRPGMMLYAHPHSELPHCGVKPVMKVTAPVLNTMRMQKGDFIGYDRSYEFKSNTNVALVGIGYGDGYPISANVGTPVCIEGVLYPVVGRVTMDFLVVDTGQKKVRIGSTAELWGENICITELGKKAGVIPYDIFVKLQHRRFAKEIVYEC